MLASVVLDIPTQALDAPYTYLVPEDVDEGDYPIQVGCAVVVPLGGRRAVGFVVSMFDESSDEAPRDLDPTKLKHIQRAVSSSYFDEEGAACALWISQRYIAPLSACVRLFTPPGGVPRMVRARGGYWRLEQPSVGEVDDRWVVLSADGAEFEPRANAVKQKSIIEALKRGELRMADLTAEFGNVSSTVKALAEKGVVRIERRRRFRGMEGAAQPSVDPSGSGAGCESGEAAFVPSARPDLTDGQAEALRVIEAACEQGTGEVVLVDGVTGSGKTEVYLQAIENVLAHGRTACVLVPEISLTPQTVARFRGRFGDMVAVMHSRMSDGERYDQWDFVRSGKARVVVGARSALFTPLRDVGLIVIDEEHEGSYKQDSAPRYHARDVAVWMARRSGAAVVLGSATPSIETLYAVAKDDAWHAVVLPERANGRPMPRIEIVDMAREFGSGSRSMFSRQLSEALRDELAAGNKAVMLLNQRGFAQFLLCRDCGFVPSCPSCSTSLTYHERGNLLMCHHCGYRITAPATCPECASPYLKRFGAGTQRVEDELRALIAEFGAAASETERERFASIPVIRMDADTTTRKGAHQRLLDQFAQPGPAVLLGTQMIAKGLDFEDVTLVGVINADTQLHLPDYRASERTFDLIEQVAGRAGRAELEGRVLVQTYEADSPAIVAAATYNRAHFLRDELPKRKALRYPPYVHLANVLVWGSDEEEVRKTAESLRDQAIRQVRDFGSDSWRVLSATPCVFAKLRNVYRWHILLKAPLDADMAPVLAPLLRQRRASKDVNVTIDIDPQSIL